MIDPKDVDLNESYNRAVKEKAEMLEHLKASARAMLQYGEFMLYWGKNEVSANASGRATELETFIRRFEPGFSIGEKWVDPYPKR